MTLALSLGTGGTLHAALLSTPVPAQTPAGEGWSLTRAPNKAFRKRLFRPLPVEVQESDSVVWKRIQGLAAQSPRDYILRAIAGDLGGSGQKLKLSRADADRLVFGSGLRKSEQHRNFLTSDGIPFDSFIHSIAVPDFMDNSYGLSGSALSDVESEWQQELESVVSECLSTRHARTMLIESYRAATRREREEFPAAF